jgi:hypothetical protein
VLPVFAGRRAVFELNNKDILGAKIMTQNNDDMIRSALYRAFDRSRLNISKFVPAKQNSPEKKLYRKLIRNGVDKQTAKEQSYGSLENKGLQEK